MINSNAILEINTKNFIYNYKSLSKIANNSLTAATIKAHFDPNFTRFSDLSIKDYDNIME